MEFRNVQFNKSVYSRSKPSLLSLFLYTSVAADLVK